MDKTIIDSLIEDVKNRQIDEAETAGLMYEEYAELARVAERGKNRAMKRLTPYKPGTYGGIVLVLKRSEREYPDMEKIAATYVEHGLGPVPMKPAEAKLKVEFAAPKGDVS